MIITTIALDGSYSIIPTGNKPTMLVVRDTNGKTLYESNDDALLNGKNLLECHYFIKRDGDVIKVRNENMYTELNRPLFDKYVMLVDIEGDFNLEDLDIVRGNSLINLVKYLKETYPHFNKIVPYSDIDVNAKTPGLNFPTKYVNELIANNAENYYIKVDRILASENPYLKKRGVIYKTRDLFLSQPYISGEDVLILKYRLNTLGFNIDTNNDSYNEETVVIINNLRQKLGLPRNGRATIDLMNEIDVLISKHSSSNTIGNRSVSFTRLIELTDPPMDGRDVKRVQQILYANGYYNGELNGTFTEETETALKQFQKSIHVTQNGIVTPTLWNMLTEYPIAKFERLIYLTSPNMEGEDILTIQNQLIDIGYDNLIATGFYDEQTNEIVKKFQRNNGLRSDGKITRSVFNKLFK